ncbi:MAG: hypothetical protein GXY05_02225 [Clostridiales bacterium]|nr:hypothetical protein [Clostridiales bacterium]
MVTKKYAKDFTIKYEETPSGRLKARAVYTGRYYAFSDTDEKVGKTAKFFTLLLSVALIAFLVPLFIISTAARTSYVILPHALCFFPLVGMSAVTVDLWTEKPPLTREKRDHISQRAPISALLMVLFSGAATAGFITRLFVSPEMLPGDLVFALCEAALLAASILLFAGRERTATREAGEYEKNE